MKIDIEIQQLEKTIKQINKDLIIKKRRLKNLKKQRIDYFNILLKNNKINEFLENVEKYVGYKYLVKSRRVKYTIVRSAVIHILCNQFKGVLKLKQLGKLINDFDHSTVIHNRDLMQNMLDTDNKLYVNFNKEIELIYKQTFNEN